MLIKLPKLIKFVVLILVASFEFTYSYSQTNQSETTVVYDFTFQFNDGIYTSFHAFRNNSAIPFERFVSPIYDENFFTNLSKSKVVSFYDENGALNEMPLQKIWGYATNGKPYIYWSEKFNLIPYVGTISLFFTTELVTHFVNSAGPMFYYNSFYTPVTQTYTAEELVQFFIDTKTGNIISYNSKSLLELLKDDSELYEEYSKLGKRKRSKKTMEYVQKYNQRNPIMFKK